MGNAQVSISSLPNIDMSVIAEQMRQLSSNFTDGGIVNGLVTGIAGAAVGGAIAMLLGGPLTWLIGGGAILANWFFGEEKTEKTFVCFPDPLWKDEGQGKKGAHLF